MLLAGKIWMTYGTMSSLALVNVQLEFLMTKSTVVLSHGWGQAVAKLKAVDTISNCQSLAFTVGVSQCMHKITNLWKI